MVLRAPSWPQSGALYLCPLHKLGLFHILDPLRQVEEIRIGNHIGALRGNKRVELGAKPDQVSP
jgi:hypothetical protein